jgi:hypothetical protein
MEQDYRRGVTETFLNALSRGFNLDGEVRSFWIQDSRGHGLFKELSIMSLWFEDTTFLGKSLYDRDRIRSVV